MAILKQGHMKEDRTSSNPSRHLKVAIAYILNAKKCENGRLAGAVNCVATPDLAYRQMMQTKRTFGKLHGRQGYHYILSFTEGEIIPETALEVTEKFVQGYLEGRYEAVYAVHTDTEHVHAHIIFNSVGLDGYKYHAPKGEWRQNIMPIVNQLCEEYGLSEIRLDEDKSEETELEETEPKELPAGKDILNGEIPLDPGDNLEEVDADDIPEKRSVTVTDYFADTSDVSGTEEVRKNSPKTGANKSKNLRKESIRNPLYGRKGSGYGSSAACLSAMLRRDIDECIGESRSMDEFYRLLKSRGYSLRISGNRTPALKHEGMERVRRFSSLGEGYSIEEIEERIRSGEQQKPEPGISKDEVPPGLSSSEDENGLEPFRSPEEPIPKKLGREIFFCLLISGEAYSRAYISKRAVYAYNDFYNLRDAYEFVHKYNIRSEEDLEELCEEYGKQLKEARSTLRKINRSLSKDEAQSDRFALLQQYRGLQDAVLLYQNGDESYYADYLKAEKLLDRIAATGKSVDEIRREFESLTGEIEIQKERISKAQEVLRSISNVRAAMKRETPSEVMERIVEDAREKNQRAEKRKEKMLEKSKGRRI